MTEYFKKFTMDKDGVNIIDFGENEVYSCKYSDEAKSLCNRLNDLDYEKYNLKKENEELKEEHRRIIDLLDKKLQENDDNDEYARKVKIDLIMELKKELG